MKKYILDMEVTGNTLLNANYLLLKLTDPKKTLPEMLPGQFAQIRVDRSKNTFLRRPISINFIDRQTNEVWFLIQMIGEGTSSFSQVKKGETVNVVLPLGNTFSYPEQKTDLSLLVGGGVGLAPLLFWGYTLKQNGYRPTFLLGARSKLDLLELDLFRGIGDVYTTTDDGSYGEKGIVTSHSILSEKEFNQVYTCGPKPMMVAVARLAKSHNLNCEASLENSMACGIGACLCCVENIKEEGNVCVCKEGPIFNVNKLLWQI
jgi:dihydroorotate dehydrogenase electron transfer subunit